ncbi:MAG: AbrB/MazE/SpoVT family DNA-binding domain-containing protein [Spirochaetaceae bacterium]|nr:AbrB/MazE/SpoVT family DNA-binding domain-containing protein [Spirochaetaceae bacterium]
MMVVKVTAKRQVTFPAAVLEAIGVGPGDRLELHEGPDGFLLRPQRIDFDSLAPLRDKVRRDAGPFDLEEFRSQPHDPALRD